MSKVSFKKENSRFAILSGLILAGIALILSALLVCKHDGICTASMGCEINGLDGCAELAKSSYSRFSLPFVTGGVSIAWLGFLYYGLLFFFFVRLQFAALQKSTPALGLLAAVVVFGLVFDLFLAYRNFFVLQTPCLLCSYTYLCQLSLVFAAFWLYFAPQNEATFNISSKAGIANTLWREIKATRFVFAGAFILAFIYMGLLAAFSSDSNAGAQDVSSKTGDLLPLNDVQRTLRELHALKSVNVNEKKVPPSYVGNLASAYIKIHEWLDFRCPHCRQASKVLSAAQQRWPGRILIYYRQFPLDGNCNPHLKRKQPGAASCKAAQAALCIANAQNSNAGASFKDFAHGLLAFQSSQTPINRVTLKELSVNMGYNWRQINSCMNSARTNKLLQADIQTAEKFNITATPTIVINQRILPAGTPEINWLKRILDALVLEREGEAAIEDYVKRSHTNHTH